MYLNITASKDTYIQNKILNNKFRTSDANVGQAGTLDLFKLYAEASLPVIEAVNQSEVISVVLPDHNSSSENLDGLYFTIYDAADIAYYVWFNVNSQDNEPIIADATAIEIAIVISDGKEDIAATLTTAMGVLPSFSAVDQGAGEVQITIDTKGLVKNASSGTVADEDFSVNVVQQGSKAGTFNLDVDNDLIPETAVELSRIFVDFDLDVLDNMLTLDTTHTDFKATLHLYDILDGQMAPTNFNVEVFPMAQSFTEGGGRDTGAFSDLDICNFVTASYSGSPMLWNSPGADAKGNVGTTGLDVYCSSSAGASQLYVAKEFVEGTEQFTFDVSDLVKEMTGNSPSISPNGFRISFSELEEQDAKTYFLKRFASRHVLNQYLRPRLCISWNDSFRDNNKNAVFDAETKLHFQNMSRGTPVFATDYELTGSPLELEFTFSTGSYSSTVSAPRLTAWGTNDVEQAGMYEAVFTAPTIDGTRTVSSQSEVVRIELVDHNESSENLLGLYFSITNTDSETYNFWFGETDDAAPLGLTNPRKIIITTGDTAASIASLAATTVNDTPTMAASVFSLGIVHVTLAVEAPPSSAASSGTITDDDFSITTYQAGTSITLQDHITTSGSITFDTAWTGNSDPGGTGTTITLHEGTLQMTSPTRSAFNATARNLTFSLLNVKPAYKLSERAKFRVFAKDYNEQLGASKISLDAESVIFDEMYYRIRDAISGDLIIPFENDNNGTRCSTDTAGMYFEIMMSSLFPGRAYTVDLLIIADGNEIVYECDNIKFRVD